MKKAMISLSVVAVMIFWIAGISSAATGKTNPVGTWHFKAPDASYEYSTGDIVIKKEKGKYAGEIVFSEYYTLETQNFKVQKNIVTFNANVEGEVVYFKGTIKGNKLTGKASYSEGTLDVTAEKIGKKKK